MTNDGESARYAWMRDRDAVVKETRALIELWDRHSARPWSVAAERHGMNVAFVNAYVSHTVNLSRAVLLLVGAGLSFESVSLVRSSMESTVTAAWHVLFPEKSRDFVIHSASERKKVLEEIEKHGFGDSQESLDRSTRSLRMPAR